MRCAAVGLPSFSTSKWLLPRQEWQGRRGTFSTSAYATLAFVAHVLALPLMRRTQHEQIWSPFLSKRSLSGRYFAFGPSSDSGDAA